MKSPAPLRFILLLFCCTLRAAADDSLDFLIGEWDIFNAAGKPSGTTKVEAALPGAALTALALVTGSLWGRPMWGAWWVWGDARLMSELVLLLFYLGYMALRASIDDEAKAARAAAVLGLVGLINLPIVKFSVDWWNTLHQPASLLRADGPAMTADLLAPLLTMMAAFAVFFLAVWITSIRTEIVRRRVLTLRARRALEA